MPNIALPNVRLDEAQIPDVMAAVDEYTYVDYLENWYDHFGQAESATVEVKANGHTSHIVLWTLSVTQFEGAKAELKRLHEVKRGELLPGAAAQADASILFCEAQLLL